MKNEGIVWLDVKHVGSMEQKAGRRLDIIVTCIMLNIVKCLMAVSDD